MALSQVLPWQELKTGVRLRVRLTPKADRDALGGLKTLADGSCVLEARVRAVPEDGKANAALIKLLAHSLDVPKSAIALDHGASGRIKAFMITADAIQLLARLDGQFPPL